MVVEDIVVSRSGVLGSLRKSHSCSSVSMSFFAKASDYGLYMFSNGCVVYYVLEAWRLCPLAA
jgi:hypothetical protein